MLKGRGLDQREREKELPLLGGKFVAPDGREENPSCQHGRLEGDEAHLAP
jgi:hypothetical protein